MFKYNYIRFKYVLNKGLKNNIKESMIINRIFDIQLSNWLTGKCHKMDPNIYSNKEVYSKHYFSYL